MWVSVWLAASTVIVTTYTLVGFSGENVYFQYFSPIGCWNFHKSLPKCHWENSEHNWGWYGFACHNLSWKKIDFLINIFPLYSCLIISPIGTASCWWDSFQLSDLYVFPQWPRQQRLLPQPQVRHVASHHLIHKQFNSFSSAYCGIYGNSYSGPQHNLKWEFRKKGPDIYQSHNKFW